MAMATGTVWRDRAGRKKREIEEKLRGGTNPSKIESDWQELETLYDRAGLLDLYDRDMIIDRTYVPTEGGVFTPEEYSRVSQGLEPIAPGPVAASNATAATFDDLDEEDDDDEGEVVVTVGDGYGSDLSLIHI